MTKLYGNWKQETGNIPDTGECDGEYTVSSGYNFLAAATHNDESRFPVQQVGFAVEDQRCHIKSACSCGDYSENLRRRNINVFAVW